MPININRISLQNVTFAGVGMGAVVLDIDDGYSNGQISINGANVTNLQLAQAIFAAIEGGVYAAGIRINRSNAQSLFPSITLTAGNEIFVVTNRNSSSVVATEIQGYVTVQESGSGADRGICSTYDVRGLGNYVYSPLTFWRVNGDNNRFLYYERSSTPPKYYILARDELGLDESQPFPSVYQSGVDMEYRAVSGSSNATMSFFGETHVESKPYPGQDTDPYAPGGESEPGGGDGDHDDDSDDIDFPDLPPDELSDTGFITLFNPSSGQMKSLANFLWSGLFDINSWKKLFGDPMQAILGLSQVPVNVPNGGTADVTVGNILTNVPMTKAGARFVSVDCGSISVKKYWGAYIDFAPYTKAEIYLPYIGTRAIDIDDIMGKSVHVRYHVDILNGSCIAYIKCGNSVLYSFAGQCAMSIPITGDNWTNAINGIITMVAAGAGAMAATGGAAAPAAMPPGVDAPASAMASAGGALTAQTAGSIASTAVNSLKPTIQKSGVLGGGSGMLGIRRPYLIITRPRPCIPKGQNKFTGYPSYIHRKLGDVDGYTEIEKIHLVKCPATGPETAEIEQILRGGVIF